MRGLDCPVHFALTASQKDDAPQAETLLKDLPAEVVLTGAASDSDRLHKLIPHKGATAVLPNNPSRAGNRALYKERHLIEGCCAKLKQFRRIVNCYEKTARNDTSVVPLPDIVLWIR